jgi:hypothetical protein
MLPVVTKTTVETLSASLEEGGDAWANYCADIERIKQENPEIYMMMERSVNDAAIKVGFTGIALALSCYVACYNALRAQGEVDELEEGN